MKEVIFNLREVRKRLNLTQVELAEKLNVTQQHISAYESREIMPGIDTAKIIADALGVSLDELVIIRENQDNLGKHLKSLENKTKL